MDLKKKYEQETKQNPYCWDESGQYARSGSYSDGYVKWLEEQLRVCGVVSSAWYCKISTINGQWFEIVTGKNEMEVAIKITEKFGKGTVYNLIDKYELM